MNNIKNIIFDLGGVFIEVDYFKTEKAFVGLGVPHFSELYTQQFSSPLFEALEVGEITPAQFFNNFREASGTDLTNQQIRTSWNAMLGDFYTDALHWLGRIAKRYNVYLFSNTNKIHKDCFEKIYANQTRHHDFDAHFIKTYYSHELGLRKPNPESFKAIIEEQKLNPSETLFVDDNFQNVKGAIEAGIQGYHLVLPRKVNELEL